jgi:multiple sugar transport system substrate-binding protein
MIVSAVLAITGCGAGSQARTADGKIQLRFAWWGSDHRHEITREAIAAFERDNPTIAVLPEFGGGGSAYWDKLTTQVAAGDTPDIIQMDEQYLRAYGDRGSLLDLKTQDFDTSKFAPGTVDSGVVNDQLLAINNGINAPTIVANPAIFEAAGVELPDDSSWTWDDYVTISAKITAAGLPDVYGSSSFTSSDYTFGTWLRQQGKQLFTADGLGFDAADATRWFELALRMQDEKAIPPAGVVTEDEALELDQTAITQGKVAMTSNVWTNQVGTLDEASGQDLKILRLPTTTGKAADGQLWYKASQFFSVSAKTEHPAEAAKLIDFLVNSTEAVGILGTDRGVPPNTEARASIESELEPGEKKVFAYLAAIEPELGPAPAPPPAGASKFADTLKRFGQEVLFRRLSPQQAGQAMVDELNQEL